jgi:hypothetical protein
MNWGTLIFFLLLLFHDCSSPRHLNDEYFYANFFEINYLFKPKNKRNVLGNVLCFKNEEGICTKSFHKNNSDIAVTNYCYTDLGNSSEFLLFRVYSKGCERRTAIPCFAKEIL